VQMPTMVASRHGFKSKVCKGASTPARFDVLWVMGGGPAALVDLMRDKHHVDLDFLIRLGARGRLAACGSRPARGPYRHDTLLLHPVAGRALFAGA
jgi:hypothetical protein